MSVVRIGLLGLGTIGVGVARILLENRAILERRLGKEVRLVRACDLDITIGLDDRINIRG